MSLQGLLELSHSKEITKQGVSEERLKTNIKKIRERIN